MRNQCKGVISILSVILLTTFVLAVVVVSTELAKTGISAKINHRDSVEALFLAESGLERASWLYANNTACIDLADGAVTFGSGSFEIIQASASSNCVVRVMGKVNNAMRTIEADLIVSSRDAWAVGKKGTILQRVNGVWSTVASGTTDDLKGISCSAVTDCWAVGKNGSLLHWDGSNWSVWPSLNGDEDYNDISCVSGNANFCVVIGKDGSGIARRWNGAWSAPTAFSEELKAIDCIDDHCFAVGKNSLGAHYNLNSWQIEDLNTNEEMKGVSCISSTECWGVGKKQQNKFTLTHRTASSTWTEVTLSSNQKQDLNTVWCSSATNCWAAAKNGRLLRLNGGAWSYYGSVSNQELKGLMCNAVGDQCYAVGKNGSALAWNGASWVQASTNTTESLESVYLFDGASSSSVSQTAWHEIVN